MPEACAPPAPAAQIAAAPPAPRSADSRRAQALAMLREGYAEAQIAKRSGLELAEVTAMVSAAEAEARDPLLARMPTETITELTGLSAGAIRVLRREMAGAA